MRQHFLFKDKSRDYENPGSYYTLSSLYYQIKLPLDLGILISADDPVRLLSAFVEGMELSDLYKTYGKIKKNHATLARFISLHFSKCSKKTLAEVTNILYQLGEISGKSIFIDGTKIESAANKYTFVWKKAVTKSQAKLFGKIFFIKNNGQISYIKPTNYEISKTRKYKNDISRMENMVYDEENDSYYCKNGKVLTAQYEKKEKTSSGYQRTITVYKCGDCAGCPHKTGCIKGNNCKTPMEERQKVLYVSKKMKQQRQETLERLTSEYGTQLRMNRSIQAEGSFANTKEDMEFRRYLYRGKENVTAQSILLAIGYNINKLHHKIQSGRTGQHLFPLKKTA